MKQNIHAIYRARDDGDWQFVCAFNVEALESNSLVAPISGAAYVREQCDGMNETDENALYRVVRFEDATVPNVLADDRMPPEYNLLSPDGIAIRAESFYSEDEAMDYAKEWAGRYIPQGYYHTAQGERIPVIVDGKPDTGILIARLQLVED